MDRKRWAGKFLLSAILKGTLNRTKHHQTLVLSVKISDEGSKGPPPSNSVKNVWWSCWSCPRLVGVSPHYVVVQVQIFVLFLFSNPLWTFLCCCLVTKSCPTLCNPMKCSPPDSSVHGIPQAKILNSVAISFSREYSSPRDQSHVFCIGKRNLYHWTIRKPTYL